MTGARTRAVIVVFDATTTDTEAALVRNGLAMFRGIERVVPVRGCPTDSQARTLIARDDVVQQLAACEEKVRELTTRLDGVQQFATGPVPVAHETELGVEWRQSS